MSSSKLPSQTRRDAPRRKRALSGLLAMMALVGIGGAARAQDVAGGNETVRRAIHVCASCHGAEGRSTMAGVPSLAGQMPQYLMAQLKDFRNQTRVETGTRAYMWGVSALLDDAAITGLAEYYAGQKPAAGHAAPASPGGHAAPAAGVNAGRRIFTTGMPERGVRACASCHGDSAEGAAGFPRLAGQRAGYLLAQLKVFGTKLRPHGVVMQAETKGMTAAEMRAVAAYLQTL